MRAGACRARRPGTWDAELARHGIALRDDRAAAIDAVAPAVTASRPTSAWPGDVELRYRPRTKAATRTRSQPSSPSAATPTSSADSPTHGPHRDDLALMRDGRDLRIYGSQGEQRLALLSLLLAERSVLEAERGAAPVMLLDDVMSELDADRRGRLVERLRGGGQAIVTTTDLAHVPDADGAGRRADRGVRRRGAARGRGMRTRRAPRQAGGAVARLVARASRPPSGLAALQRAWPETVGEVIAAQAHPSAERAGVVTVTCSSSVWAQELTLMGPDLRARLNAALGGDVVREFRFRAAPAGAWAKHPLREHLFR